MKTNKTEIEMEVEVCLMIGSGYWVIPVESVDIVGQELVTKPKLSVSIRIPQKDRKAIAENIKKNRVSL